MVFKSSTNNWQEKNVNKLIYVSSLYAQFDIFITNTMSTNKHAQIRYNALDNCFSNYGRKYYIKDLVQACNEAIYNFSGKDEGVRKRQIYDPLRIKMACGLNGLERIWR